MEYISDRTADESLVNRKLKSLALPLIDISDTNNLNERVIDPLLSDMTTS